MRGPNQTFSRVRGGDGAFAEVELFDSDLHHHLTRRNRFASEREDFQDFQV